MKTSIQKDVTKCYEAGFLCVTFLIKNEKNMLLLCGHIPFVSKSYITRI